MKKIAFVTPWYGENIPGGAEMELRGISNHIGEIHEVEILTTCVENFNSDWNTNFYNEGEEKIGNVLVRRFEVRQRNTKAFDDVNYKLMFNQMINSDEEEIYLKEMVNSPKLYEYIRMHKDEYFCFIFIPYMFGTTYYGILECLDKAIMIPCFHNETYIYIEKYREAFENLKAMIYHADPEYALANQVFDLSRVKQAVLGEGVYTEFEYDANRFKEKYHINEDFILYAGRKDKGKQVDMLLDYFNEYKYHHNNDLKLVLIGGGEIEIPRQIKNDVFDLGFVDVQDKYDAYAAALLCCQPSSHESFSLVIMESWLCERPVLVNEDCDVTKNFVEKTDAGLYFGSYQDFSGAIDFYLNNKDIAKEMGKTGRKFVLENFSWKPIVDKYMKFIKEVIGEENE